jgi:hypothetical protein
MHFCRTSDLGSRTYRCDPCNYETTVFNSCGDRNCPQCSGAKRSKWLDRVLDLTMPQVTYFQVVFTLPEQLSSLALGNRKAMYKLLFRTAWESLKTKIEKELGIQAGGVAVLHTWNQRLGHHPHVHLMVPGNGLSLDGQRWIDCRMVWSKKSRSMQPFLVDNKELGRDFRDLFLIGLSTLVEQGKIRLEEAGYIADLIGELRDRDWVAFVEGPPKPDCPPSQMLKYLTKYMTGGPISNGRIVGEKNGRIYFKARSKRKGEGLVETSLSTVEFVQQWSLHILPKEFTRTRYFGMWSSSKRKIYLDRCRDLAPKSESKETDTREPGATPSQATEKKKRCCPHCQAEMECVRTKDRPSWRELFYGPAHPFWFEWTSLGRCTPPDALLRTATEPPEEEPPTEVTMDFELESVEWLLASLIE